ncbi:hypothetical protein C8J57DRAFT_1506865 [Mycena rebaudengoi]|nr:hypothetical protein C8J57DRAFT_1506865 [Mycena rebaudengoi]
MSGLPITDSATEDDLPGYNPPAYEVARVPLEAFNYTLSPTSDNALLLLPPPRSPDSHPQYRISVSLNCLNPFSSITTVRRGASLDGPFVGEIQMGISTLPATVCLGDRQKQLYDVMSNLKTVRTRWTWTFRDDPAQHIRWELNNFSTGVFNVGVDSTHQRDPNHRGSVFLPVLRIQLPHIRKLRNLKAHLILRTVPSAPHLPCCEYIHRDK